MKKGFAVTVKNEDGINITITYDLDAMSEAERSAFLKFHSAGNLEALTEDERTLLASRKTYLRDGIVTEGFCCRWDWHPYIV